MWIRLGIWWTLCLGGKGRPNENKKDIFEIFERDESFKYIMKRLLEASMEEYFNSLAISDTSPFKKISAISDTSDESINLILIFKVSIGSKLA